MHHIYVGISIYTYVYKLHITFDQGLFHKYLLSIKLPTLLCLGYIELCDT